MIPIKINLTPRLLFMVLTLAEKSVGRQEGWEMEGLLALLICANDPGSVSVGVLDRDSEPPDQIGASRRQISLKAREESTVPRCKYGRSQRRDICGGIFIKRGGVVGSMESRM